MQEGNRSIRGQAKDSDSFFLSSLFDSYWTGREKTIHFLCRGSLFCLLSRGLFYFYSTAIGRSDLSFISYPLPWKRTGLILSIFPFVLDLTIWFLNLKCLCLTPECDWRLYWVSVSLFSTLSSTSAGDEKVRKRRREWEKWFMVCNSYPCISSITVSVVLKEALNWRSMTWYLVRGEILWTTTNSSDCLFVCLASDSRLSSKESLPQSCDDDRNLIRENEILFLFLSDLTERVPLVVCLFQSLWLLLKSTWSRYSNRSRWTILYPLMFVSSFLTMFPVKKS